MNLRCVVLLSVFAVSCGGAALPPVESACSASSECAPDEVCRGGQCVPKPMGCKPVLEICNGVDDDCDGLVDEDVCLPVDAGAGGGAGGGSEVDAGAGGGAGGGSEVDAGAGGGAGGGGEVDAGAGGGAGGDPGGGAGGGGDIDAGEVDGGEVDGGTGGTGGGMPSCVPAPEVCDGVDNDCDGQIDEALTVVCYGDADGDRYATTRATVTLCADLSRPAAGYCPPGYVSQTASLGADCDPTNANLYRIVSTRADADNDTYCAGAATNTCVGATLPAGRRLPTSCDTQFEDCNDNDASAFTVSVFLDDADHDHYCSGQLDYRCAGNTAPAGKEFVINCYTQDDCNDANASLWRLMSVRPDVDNDGYCFGPTTSQCGGTSPPSGFRWPTTCNAIDDCRDTNPLANAQCVLTGAYTTTSATKICAFKPATETFTVSTATICPLGFTLGAYVANKQPGSMSGSCTATGPLTLSMTCNGLDGATCNIVGACLAL